MRTPFEEKVQKEVQDNFDRKIKALGSDTGLKDKALTEFDNARKQVLTDSYQEFDDRVKNESDFNSTLTGQVALDETIKNILSGGRL